MKELVVFCEGPTEQGFCKEVLQPHLFPKSDGLIHTLAVGRKNNHHVYGISKYQPLRKFIANTLKQRKQKSVTFTSMIDLYAQKEIAALVAIAAKFPSIEHIDDGKDAAPSKRIIDVLPAYLSRKASAGPVIAAKIGLPVLRQKCPHFHSWLTRLETHLGETEPQE